MMVASCPEFGLDDEGGYTFPVMDKIVGLTERNSAVCFGFDWAGGMAAFPEDKDNFDVVSQLWTKWNEADDREAKIKVSGLIRHRRVQIRTFSYLYPAVCAVTSRPPALRLGA